MPALHTPSIRSRLTLLVIACVAPATLLALLLVAHDYLQARTELLRRLDMASHMHAQEIDKVLADTASILATLATSPTLNTADLPALYRQAQTVAQQRGLHNLVLEDTAGKQYFNTLRPLDSRLPVQQSPSRFAATLERGIVTVTNIFRGPVSQRLIAAVGVPAVLGQRSDMVLSASLPIEQFQSLLAEKAYPPNWLVTVMDASGNIVARSHDSQRYAGQHANADVLRHIAQHDGQAFETHTLEGTPILAAIATAPVSGWSVAIGIPLQQFSSELYQKFRWLLAATVLMLVIGLGLAWRLARTISKAISLLVRPALALGNGEPVTPQRYGIREAEEVGLALCKAAQLHLYARHQASHDGLTGMANRSMFFGYLEQHLALCQRNQSALSLLYLDLDGFKPVNDLHGHAVGDRLLIDVASRLRLALRKSDLAARLGGDEFGVVLIDAELDEALALADKLGRLLAQPYQVNGISVQVSASIGLANYPLHGGDASALIEVADRNMYAQKFQKKTSTASVPG